MDEESFVMVSTADCDDQQPKAEPKAEAEAAAADLARLLTCDEHYSPRDIADFLHRLPQLDPKTVGNVLGKSDALALDVLDEYANGFVFTGYPFDLALRVYLGRFVLPNEAQQIDRILQAFAKAFCHANPQDPVCSSQDAVYTLAFSVMLLHTDAHNPRLARHRTMTQDEFLRIHQHAAVCTKHVSKQFLTRCYTSFATMPIQLIQRKPAAMQPDELELTFADGPLGLVIETALDTHTCIVKQYARPHRHVHCSSPTVPNLAGYVVVAVGEDSTYNLDYTLTRYLLKTAARPVTIRFCDPSVFFEAMA